MTAEEMLNKKIQHLETSFTELLADEADSALLGRIWTEIQMLRTQLEQLTLESSMDSQIGK